jgi:lysozyme
MKKKLLKDEFEEMIIRHEGLKLKPYRCTAGKLTIGVGRNLDDNGITEAEAIMMLKYDIEVARSALLRYGWFVTMDSIRQEAIINMVFNLGMTRFLQFKKTIAHLQNKEWNLAAKEMLNSKWAEQVGNRAKEIAGIIITGKY